MTTTSFRPDPLHLFRSDEPSITNAGDGGLYFNGDIPRSRSIDNQQPAASANGQSRWTGEVGFFDAARYELLDRLVEQVIPSDQHSPSASSAGVPSWLDRLIAASPADDQHTWQEGLDSIDRFAEDSLGLPYMALTYAQQVSLLEILAKNEFSAKTTAEMFFKQLKHATWDMYYRTEVGIHLDLQYAGNGFNKSLT